MKSEPLYVAIITPVIHYCMEGLVVDADSACVGSNNLAVPGLYERVGEWKWLSSDSCRCFWFTNPAKTRNHDAHVGQRIGEASHPGPASQIGLDFGPNFAAQLQAFIQEAVQQALREALKGLQLGGLLGFGSQHGPPPAVGPAAPSASSTFTQAVAPSPVPTPPRKKGKGAGAAVATVAQPAPVVSAPTSAPKGKAKGKPRDADQGWTKVQKKKTPADTEDFKLRQQDWTDPLVSFSSLAKKLEDTKDGQVCRGVMLCTQHETKIASSLFAGTAKTYAFLVIVLAKHAASEDAKATGAVRQQVPGQVGLILKSSEALVYQVHSPGQAPPQYAGASGAPQKIAPKATTVLFCKVIQAFTSAALWKGFTEKPQKQIALYTAQHHVLCNDCFGWAEELTKPGCRQVFGIIRVAQADLSVLLALSGEQGIFFQLPKDRVKNQYVEWAPRLTKTETDMDYLTRVNRTRGDLGLACRDKSLGWRRNADASSVVKKVWVLEHAPREWDMQQVSQLLAEHFNEVCMFRQLQRKGWKNFVFRGACKRGADADLVPITVQIQEGDKAQPFTLWAKVAPPRQVEYKQRQIKAGAVPFFDSKSILDPVAASTTVPDPQDPAQNSAQADSKTPPPNAKRQRTTVRHTPKGLTLQAQPKDGDCLFHSFRAGLQWLNRKKKDYNAPHPHELRARMLDHLQRHCDRYQAPWEAAGKIGPDGSELPDWKAFLEAASKQGAYAGETELKALCRIFDVRVILVPEDSNFAVCTYHRAGSKRRTVAVFYSEKHFDFLEPTDAQNYPDDILNVDVDPTGGFLVGGISEAGTVFTSCSSAPGTVWTKAREPAPASTNQGSSRKAETARARASSSARASGGEDTVFTRAAPHSRKRSAQTRPAPSHPAPSQPISSRVDVPPGRVQGEGSGEHSDAESQDLQGCEVEAPKRLPSALWRACPYRPYPPPPKDLTFKCERCPFRKVCKSVSHYRCVRHQHCKQAHDGKGLPGRLLQPRLQRLPDRISAGDWRCPLCKEGLRKKVLAQISPSCLYQIRLQHWQAAHAKEVSRAAWTALLRAQPKPKRPKQWIDDHAKDCQKRKLTKAVIAEVQNARFPTLTMFAWPRRKSRKGKGERVTVEHAWSCNKCGRAIRRLKDAREHVISECPPVPESLRTKHETELKELRAWILTKPKIRQPPQLQKLIASALEAVRRRVD